jgi:predicted metal-dependent HD superfamily phosphohydrolase
MSKTTTANTIVADTEQYVRRLLTEELTEDHRYHNLPHTLSVRQVALEIARRLHLDGDDLEMLELASLLHDTGFVEVYEGHEAVSHRIAREFLEERGYPERKLRQVLECIDATFPANRPTSQLSRIIRDADLANLGNSNYPESLAALRHEWEVFLGQNFNDRDWYRLNRDFIKKQRYHTHPAEEMFAEGKKNE